MVDNYRTAEVIAQLDTLERQMRDVAQQVREFRLALFETLDNDDDDLVD